ncbi:MAG TPA: PhoU domain-containing protein [Pyrinomonadaceae bacterium]
MESHRPIDEHPDLLRARLLALGGEAETALQRAMHSLAARDSEEARGVLRDDDRADRLEVESTASAWTCSRCASPRRATCASSSRSPRSRRSSNASPTAPATSRASPSISTTSRS